MYHVLYTGSTEVSAHKPRRPLRRTVWGQLPRLARRGMFCAHSSGYRPVGAGTSIAATIHRLRFALRNCRSMLCKSAWLHTTPGIHYTWCRPTGMSLAAGSGKTASVLARRATGPKEKKT
nr:hypothetical protein CFP56_67005 [Quercus suber]